MLQRHRPFKGVLDVHFFPLGAADPLSELFVVRYGGREHDDGDGVGQFDNDFFPDVTAFRVINIVHLVKDDPLHILDVVAVVVQHGLEHLRGHNHAASVSIKGHIASKNTHIAEFQLEIAVLLVREGLDRRGIDCLGHVLARQCDRILCHEGLSGGRVRRHEDAVALFEAVDGSFLELV